MISIICWIILFIIRRHLHATKSIAEINLCWWRGWGGGGVRGRKDKQKIFQAAFFFE